MVDRLSEGDESTLESVQALAGLSVAFSAAKGEYQVMTLYVLALEEERSLRWRVGNISNRFSSSFYSLLRR